MAFQKFQDEQHSEFQRWRRDHPNGFFLNCRSKGWMVHRVSCRHPGSSEWEAEGAGGLTQIPKVCSDRLSALWGWAEGRSRSVVGCKHCKLGGPLAAEIIEFAKSLKGKTILTAAGRASFNVYDAGLGLVFTPNSTGSRRPAPESEINTVCDEFVRTGSTRLGDYQNLTRHSSYLLTLIQLLQQIPEGPQAISSENDEGEDIDDEGAEEGRILLRSHRVYERNRGLRRKLIAARRKKKLLKCEICTREPITADPDLAEAMFEAHHIVALSKRVVRVTRWQNDLALLCANCHRTLHRAIVSKKRWISVTEARSMFGSDAVR